MDSNAPVLVVGAGPTGLTLAIMLRLYGVAVRIIDRNAEPAPVSKALAVWSGSLEALHAMGVVEKFQERGVRLKSLIAGDGPRQLAAIAVGDGIDSPYPYPLLLPQSRTEAILATRLAELGVTVERGVELAGLAQDETGVTATLKHADGREETARTSYLAGADGARSAVRHAVGIEFEGYTEPQMFLLGDVKIDGANLDRRSLYIWWHGGNTVALFPFEDGVWRIFTVREDSEDASAPTLEELQGHMDRHGPPGARISDPTWLSSFRTNERLAQRYRADRVFLAGDAAHIHSPAGGQGMNTGIQDAFNLGWKLAHVLKGRGEPELLLDSYEAERRPVAREVIRGSAQRLHVAFAPGKVATFLRDIAVTVVGNLPAVQKMLTVELSETTTVYEDGPLVALGDPPRRARRTDVGTRARDATFFDPASGASRALWPEFAPTSHTLLLFADAGPSIARDGLQEAFPDTLRILALDATSDPNGEVRDRYHIEAPGWVLVRPDQVVAARGTATEIGRVKDYLERVVARTP